MMKIFFVAASVLMATLATPVCAAQATDVGELSLMGHRRTILAEISSDTKKLYRCRQGRMDRKNPVETSLASWQPARRDFIQLIDKEWHDIPGLRPEAVTCSTYLIIEAGAAAPKCGVVCSDLTSYSMPCSADIFKGGIDIYGTVNN